ARARLAEATEARALRDTDEALPLDGVRDLDEAIPRAEKGGALDGALLIDVASTLATGARVRAHLARRGARAPRLLGKAGLSADLEEVWDPIQQSFDEGMVDGKVRLADQHGHPRGQSPLGGSSPRFARLADRASPELGHLRRRAQKVREELERKMERLLESA